MHPSAPLHNPELRDSRLEEAWTVVKNCTGLTASKLCDAKERNEAAYTAAKANVDMFNESFRSSTARSSLWSAAYDLDAEKFEQCCGRPRGPPARGGFKGRTIAVGGSLVAAAFGQSGEDFKAGCARLVAFFGIAEPKGKKIRLGNSLAAAAFGQSDEGFKSFAGAAQELGPSALSLDSVIAWLRRGFGDGAGAGADAAGDLAAGVERLSTRGQEFITLFCEPGRPLAPSTIVTRLASHMLTPDPTPWRATLARLWGLKEAGCRSETVGSDIAATTMMAFYARAFKSEATQWEAFLTRVAAAPNRLSHSELSRL